MSDETPWERLKRAALEYSTYRPRLEHAEFVPVAGQRAQTPPVGALGIEYINYGLEFTFAEIFTAGEGDQGWCFHNGRLYLTPAPVTNAPITIVWRLAHQPDELTETFPTIPPEDMLIVAWLAEAEELEEQQAAVEAGLKSYTIAGTTVTWSQEGGGGASGGTRGARLRLRALAKLQATVADWA